MEKMPQYVEVIEQGRQFLQNHNNVLKSLLLSKENADNVYTEATNGISDGPIESSQGSSESSDDSLA